MVEVLVPLEVEVVVVLVVFDTEALVTCQMPPDQRGHRAGRWYRAVDRGTGGVGDWSR